jgi:hypothetical protein
MAIYTSHDPRRYVLVVMTLGLCAMVPLTFGFVTLMPFGQGSAAGVGSVVLWLLLGAAIGALFVGTMAFFKWCTRVEDQEHPMPESGTSRPR